MIAWISRLANKSFFCCLLPVVLLTFLLHSVERFPLSTDIVLGEKERQESRAESAINTQYLPKLSNNIPFEEDNKIVENVKQNGAPSVVRQHPDLQVKLDGNSNILNNLSQAGENATVKPLLFTLNSIEETQVNTATNNGRRPQKKVLLLSSVGRSGSSFLGLLLAALDNSMYFFEPIRGIPKKYQSKENMTEELTRYFHCNVNKKLLSVGGRVSISIIHPYTFNKKRWEVTHTKVMEYCRQEPLLVVKVIRLRLQWVREIMSRKELDNVKVIHLVRDPRGTFTSMERLKWNATEKDICTKIYQDLQERETISSLYPTRYTFVKYEDLCRDPYGEARRLVHFLDGKDKTGPKVGSKTVVAKKLPVDEKNLARLLDPTKYQDLPKGILKYLNEHLHVNHNHKFGPFTVERETTSMYQRWRWIIALKQLKKVQDACGDVIKVLGHRMFSSFSDVRNSSISLFVDEPS